MVEMSTGWQLGELFQMPGPQRFGNDVFAAEPFAEVNQFAAM